MFNFKSDKQTGRNTIESSLHGFASTLALIAAFLVCPQIYDLSNGPIYAYLLNAYGDQTLAQLGVYVWTIICTAAVFFLSRAMFVLALMLVAQRLLMFAL